MKSSTDGILVMRWSSKPADHKQSRVRNNQRRHRQRVKSHIADLESRLDETQQALHKAQSTIEHLTAELDRARASTPRSCAGAVACGRLAAWTDDSSLPEQNSLPSPFQPRRITSWQQQAALDQPRASESERHFASSADNTISVYQVQAVSFLGHAPVTWASYEAAVGGEEKEYYHLQPPDPKESTTRCREAYRIIAEQNYAGLEASDLHRWLKPAFRGPCAKGDGCRVENKLLFALLDYISK